MKEGGTAEQGTAAAPSTEEHPGEHKRLVAAAKDDGAGAEVVVGECVRCSLKLPTVELVVLEHCSHPFCKQCVDKHVRRALQDVQARREQDKGKGPAGGEGAGGAAAEANARHWYEITCPLAGCGVALARDDIIAALAVEAEDGLGLSASLLKSPEPQSGDAGRLAVPPAGSLVASLKRSDGKAVTVSLTASLEALLDAYDDLVRCPAEGCGYIFERVRRDGPAEGEKVTDDVGQPVEGPALLEYLNNRFRCRQCAHVFCASCKVSPYHVGKTCLEEAHKGSSAVKRCRFCEKTLPKESKSYQRMQLLARSLLAIKAKSPVFISPDVDFSGDDVDVDMRSLFEDMFDEEDYLDDPEELRRQEKERLEAEAEAAIIPREVQILQFRMEGVHSYSSLPQHLVLELALQREMRGDQTLPQITMPQPSVEGAGDAVNQAFLVLDKEKQRRFHTCGIVGSCVRADDSEEVYQVEVTVQEDVQKDARAIRFQGEIFIQVERVLVNEVPVVTHLKDYHMEGQIFSVSDSKSRHPALVGAYSVHKHYKEEDIGIQFYSCFDASCQSLLKQTCKKIKPCGHLCYGVDEEKICLPCLEEDCEMYGVLHLVSEDPSGGEGSSSSPSDYAPKLKAVGGDFCNICWCEDLQAQPSVLLSCGHAFHKDCVKEQLRGGFESDLVNFSPAQCPLCSEYFAHPLPELAGLVKRYTDLRKHVEQLIEMQVQLEELDKDPAVTDESSEWYKKPIEYGRHIFTFYRCKLCKTAFYGGHRECGPADAVPEGDNADRKCIKCKADDLSGCGYHGPEFAIWKCRFCCDIATYFCGGMCHYCDPCHDRAGDLTIWDGWKTKDMASLPKCEGSSSCKLGVDHPPNGIEAAIGCSECNEREMMGILNKLYLPLGAYLYDKDSVVDRNGHATDKGGNVPSLCGSLPAFVLPVRGAVAEKNGVWVITNDKGDDLATRVGNRGEVDLQSHSIVVPDVSADRKEGEWLGVSLAVRFKGSQVPGSSYLVQFEKLLGIKIPSQSSLSATWRQKDGGMSGNTSCHFNQNQKFVGDQWFRLVVMVSNTDINVFTSTRHVARWGAGNLYNHGVNMKEKVNIFIGGTPMPVLVRDVCVWHGEMDGRAIFQFMNQPLRTIVRVEEEQAAEKSKGKEEAVDPAEGGGESEKGKEAAPAAPAAPAE